VYNAYIEGRLTEAQQLQKACVKLCDILKCGSNMSYFKEGLKIRGINAGYMRKPQLDIESAEVEVLTKQLKAFCKETGISLKLD